MKAHRTRLRTAWIGIAILISIGTPYALLATELLVPESKLDYGSGASSSSFMLYYGGGVPRLGLFVGQANMYPRNDRAVVRFKVAPYLLSGRPVAAAELCFDVVSFSGSEDVHLIEVSHLLCDVGSFSANDLVNAPVAGRRIAANLYRNRTCGQPVVYSCWSPTVAQEHFSPSHFGVMRFGE